MFRLVLVAATVAALAAPAGVQAQSYYDQQRGYSQSPPSDDYDAPGADNYSRYGAGRDGADRDNGGGGYGYGRPGAYRSSRDEGYRGEGQGVFTGRVGASWRDDYGRRCQWREVARRDADGYDAYKWVTICRG